MLRFYTFPDEKNPLRLKSAAVYEHPARSRIIRCCNENSWVLDYMLTGSPMRIRCGGSWRERLPGMAHLYPPGVPYEEDMRQATSIRRSTWILFQGDNAFLRTLTDNPEGFARLEDRTGELGRRLKALAEEVARHGGGVHFDAHARFFEILVLLTKARRLEEEGAYALDGFLPPQESLSQRAAAYLEAHFREALNLPQMARALGAGVSTLQHRFRAETGETVVGALRRIRVEQSLPMLQLGRPLKEIAQAVGFPNQFYYSRVFAQVTGIAPSRYVTGGARRRP